MNPTHAPTTTRHTRTGSELVRGLLAAVALTAMVVAVPAALAVVAPVHLPHTWPVWNTIRDALQRPDDGTLLIGALQVVAWLAWASFTLCTLTEVVARARHLTVPSIPLLGLTQRAAATLVTTAGLLLVTSAPIVAGLSAQAVTATAPGHPAIDTAHSAPAMTRDGLPEAAASIAMTARTGTMTNPMTNPTTSAANGRDVDRHPVVTATDGDTLWGLAERHLGDGHRYTEILDLNLGRPQPDGRALVDEHWIYPGWQIRLPLDATLPDAPATAPAAAPAGAAPDSSSGPATRVHEVVAGESLWVIATEELGGGSRYPEIYDLNAQAPQPDGGSLTDPNVIRPGWHLTLPTPAPSPGPQEASSPAASDPAADTGIPVPAAPVIGTPTVPDAATQVIAPNQPTAADDGATVTDHTATATDDEPNDATARPSQAQDFFLGLTALAAAGVLGEIARRRHLQHRARRVGQRIPLPERGSSAERAEHTLRAAETQLSIAQLKETLLTLASRCYAAERDLPRVGVVLMTATTLELHLVEDDEAAVAPFANTGPRTWRATLEAIASDSPVGDDPDRAEPYPALATLGLTDGAAVLINLEAAGTLTLTGDTDTAQDALRALVTELATSDLTGRIGLVADDSFADLAAVCDRARLQTGLDPDHLASAITSRRHAVDTTLSGVGVGDTLQARSDRAGDDIWLPVVYIAAALDEQAVTRCAPWSGSALIGVGTPAPGDWALDIHADGDATLQPLGLQLRPQTLTQHALDDLVCVLRTANDQGHPNQLDPGADDVDLDQQTARALEALPAAPTPDTPSPLPTTAVAAPLRVCVLGPIMIDGLRGGPRDRLSRRATELIVYLALRGHATGPELDEALWSGRRIDNRARNSFVYRVRQQLGADYLPVADADGIYRLGPTVTTDWADFTELARTGLAAGPRGASDLHAALDLVRNRPMLGVADSAYTWAENDVQEMIGAIVDVAHVLSGLLLAAGNHQAASITATKGLLAESCSEVLYRDAITAAQARGDRVEAARIAARLEARLTELDPDHDAEWVESSRR